MEVRGIHSYVLFLISTTQLACHGEIRLNAETKSFQGNESIYKVFNQDTSIKTTNPEAEEQCEAKYWTQNDNKGGLLVVDNSEEMEVVSRLNKFF